MVIGLPGIFRSGSQLTESSRVQKSFQAAKAVQKFFEIWILQGGQAITRDHPESKTFLEVFKSDKTNIM